MGKRSESRYPRSETEDPKVNKATKVRRDLENGPATPVLVMDRTSRSHGLPDSDAALLLKHVGLLVRSGDVVKETE